jgi:hypothetical protein
LGSTEPGDRKNSLSARLQAKALKVALPACYLLQTSHPGGDMNTTVTAMLGGKTLTAKVEPKSVDALLREADRVGLDQCLAQRWIIMAMECNDELTQKEHWILAISILQLACGASNPTGELALRRARTGGSTILCEITRHVNDRYNFNFTLGLTMDKPERASIH